MLSFILSGLRFYWRRHLLVMLGVALATAILTGSLIVGNSVDGSLRKAALQRLGRVTQAMVLPNQFFSTTLVDRLEGRHAAVLQLRGMALVDDHQVNRIQVYGCDSNFWSFADTDVLLNHGEAALNRKLARALGVSVGDEVSLRVEKPSILPREAPLSDQKNDRSVRGRFRVARILDDNELGRFSLSAEQVVPYNAFVRADWLEERIEREGRANLLLSGAEDPDGLFDQVWLPEDLGFSFRSVGPVVQLESDNIYLTPEAARAAVQIPGAKGSLTYLVNALRSGERSTPYSFVLADEQHGLAEGEMLVNRWLADELGCAIGDTVTVQYAELLPSGGFAEREREFTVTGIREMSDLEQERRLAPAFPGLTDVDRCGDWDIGIPMEEDQLQDEANEAYWEDYKQTPKAIVSLKDGQQMWSNRFGELTGVRWENVAMFGLTPFEGFRERFDPVAGGYGFLPVRAQALAAVDEAMDFGQLFVGMSFFLIVAALILTGLLFVFGMQQRTEEMGILLATGWTPSMVKKGLMLEGAVSALVGTVSGALMGVAYTRFLIFGLSNGWGGAVAGASIELFVQPGTVIAGAVSGLVCALVSMRIAIRKLVRCSARELLVMDFSQPDVLKPKAGRLVLWCACLATALAVAVSAYALWADLRSISMPFFGAGALLLISGLLFFSYWMRRTSSKEQSFTQSGLVLSNMKKRHGRSLAVAGLFAVGCFLVFAVASMKEDLVSHAGESWSGTGGYQWFGESTLPIPDRLNGVGIRVHDGDDASCLNLNRAQSPRLLGVDSDQLSEAKAFLDGEDVWALLDLELPNGEIPALVGDADTSMWGLEAKVGPETGDVLEYTDEAGRLLKVRLVGHLPMRLSVFQGSVLIAEEDFVKHFPAEDGYRMFLWKVAGGGGQVAGEAGRMPAVQKTYARYGLDVVPAVDRLLEFYTVETTYLSMFLILGILGLMVGSLGMGIVVLRNVQDRKVELALLHAVGYRNWQLKKQLMQEHGILAVVGLLIGLISAALAMVPALTVSGSKVEVGFQVGLFLIVLLSCLACLGLAVLVGTKGEPLSGLRSE